MSEELDDFINDLQGQIYKETEETYGKTMFERWQNPLYMGMIDNPDGHARVTGTCGDTMEIFLLFGEGDRVTQASFQTNGCGTSIVCASYAAEMAIGKNPDEILSITGEAILGILGGLPEEDRHCAFLASESLQEALHSYMVT
ncbi:MAG: iron-sulfur cluster assembly scaffold protein [Kiritimatiellae bacterium]|nr:iron-sulfur cluster assembly scaffold protein [Kiritimatiellia bacterium]